MCEDPHVLAPFGLGNSLMAACFWFPSFFARFALHPGWPVEPKKSQNGRMSSKGKYPCQGRSHKKNKTYADSGTPVEFSKRESKK